jgi:hypothetical protein
MSWTRLLRDDPQRLETELAKAGTTLNHLARDIRDVPELSKMTAKMSRDARQRLALQHFGDEGHLQPEHRRDWVRARSPRGTTTFRTPDFGRLPPLDDAAEIVAAAGTHRAGGRPQGSFVETETFWTVWELVLDEDASARRIAKVTDADPALEFVNRVKAGLIRDAVISDRGAAVRALRGRKTPRGFSATPDGIKLPKPKPL